MTFDDGRCWAQRIRRKYVRIFSGGRHTREPTVVGEKPKTCDATVYSRAVKRFGDGARTCDNPTTVGIKPEWDANGRELSRLLRTDVNGDGLDWAHTRENRVAR